MQSGCFSGENKNARGGANAIEGPEVELRRVLQISSRVLQFTSIPATYEATSDIKISQIAFDVLNKSGKHTLAYR